MTAPKRLSLPSMLLFVALLPALWGSSLQGQTAPPKPEQGEQSSEIHFAFLIWMAWPYGSIWILGVIVGVSMLFQRRDSSDDVVRGARFA
ncbi:MAG: hypothetical protein WA324_16890 [Bryobacteraceae bacterium]